MGSPLLIQGAGPVAIVNPAAPSVKIVSKTFTYAELVSMANGANPYTIAPAEPGKILQPLYIENYMDRTNGTAGTTSQMQVRFTGIVTSLMITTSNTAWANGPGAPLFQMQLHIPCQTTGFIGTANVDYRGLALQLVNVTNTLVTGTTGSCRFTLAYLSIPL